MLEIEYLFNDPAEIPEAIETITEFMQNYTVRTFRTDSLDSRLFVFAYNFSCCHEALELLHTIDTILDPLKVDCYVIGLRFKDHTQIRNYAEPIS